jgi:dienelactone hydrolase
MSKTQLLEYKDGDTTLEAYIAEPDSGKKPVVLIFHDWSGRNPFAQKIAEDLAALGYVGFALDMYGKGQIATTKDEKVALMTPFMQDRALLLQRANAALSAAKTLSNADTHKIAAIGFCFGGLCALDLARGGADIKGVVSFHGLLGAPEDLPKQNIRTKILALTGFDDPMVKPEQVVQFGDEMTAAKVDWQVHFFGNTMHAFMNPEANDPGFGTVYQPVSAARAWKMMQDFLKEIFV